MSVLDRASPQAEPVGGDADPAEARDRELMMRIHSGDDHRALDELMNRHRLSLVRYSLRLLGEVEGAEDTVQEAFIRLWERRKEWVPAGSPRSFLYRMVRNLALQEIEKRGVRKRWIDRNGGGEIDLESPSRVFDTKALRGDVEKAIQSLPARRREILVLSRFHRMTYREIADLLGISPQTVANHMSAAFRDLRTLLSGHRS